MRYGLGNILGLTMFHVEHSPQRHQKKPPDYSEELGGPALKGAGKACNIR